MHKTKIEYVDMAWNPVTGCLGPGGTPEEPRRCSYCYAHRLAKGRLKKLYLANPNVAPSCDPNDPFSPRFWPERLEAPLKRRKPAKIFVANMGDLFGEWLPDEWLVQVLSVPFHASQHTYLFLTKNPKGYRRQNPWLEHEWLGTTVTNQRDWDERWRRLKETKASVRFVSLEPLLGPVRMDILAGEQTLPDWFIIGALTASGGHPHPQPAAEWVRALLLAANFSNRAVFMKGNLDCEGMGIERRREWPR